MSYFDDDDNTEDRGGRTLHPAARNTAMIQYGSADIQASAMAAQVRASVEARWLVAMRSPRSMDQVRSELLRLCKQTTFANLAKYARPMGREKIVGPSIRFVEAALAAMGNMIAEPSVIYDDDNKRIVEVSVTDLEKNITFKKNATIAKVVERRSLQDGRTPLKSRRNSFGDTIYTVEATEDEVALKEGAAVSKAMRVCGLRIIPQWLIDECMNACDATMASNVSKDPDAERKRLADAFSNLGIEPVDLEEYLGHDLAKVTPAEIVELRQIFAAIRDGESTWVAIIQNRREQDLASGEKSESGDKDAKVRSKPKSKAKPKGSDQPSGTEAVKEAFMQEMFDASGEDE